MQDQRAEFFNGILELARITPSELPDAAPKRRRVLEVLPLAPPPPPRKPSPAELALQEENDGRLREHLKWRLGPVLNELKRKHKRFTKPIEVRLRDWSSVDLHALLTSIVVARGVRRRSLSSTLSTARRSSRTMRLRPTHTTRLPSRTMTAIRPMPRTRSRSATFRPCRSTSTSSRSTRSSTMTAT